LGGEFEGERRVWGAGLGGTVAGGGVGSGRGGCFSKRSSIWAGLSVDGGCGAGADAGVLGASRLVVWEAVLAMACDWVLVCAGGFEGGGFPEVPVWGVDCAVLDADRGAERVAGADDLARVCPMAAREARGMQGVRI